MLIHARAIPPRSRNSRDEGNVHELNMDSSENFPPQCTGLAERLARTGRLWPAKKRLSNLPQAVCGFSRFHGRSNLSVVHSITSNSSLYAGQAG